MASVNPRRVWLYGRVSTRKGSQDQSPAAQIDRLARAARLRGWEVVGQGIDRASGAGELPELARAIHALNAATATVLAVTDLDRLGGTMRGILDTADAIKHLGADLYIESFQIDTGGPIGAFFFQVLACFSELRRTLQNDKIARGVASARARGVTLGRPVTHVRSAKMIARARELRAGEPRPGWRAVAKQLEREKFPNVPPHVTLRRWLLDSEAPCVAPPDDGNRSANPQVSPEYSGDERRRPPKSARPEKRASPLQADDGRQSHRKPPGARPGPKRRPPRPATTRP